MKYTAEQFDALIKEQVTNGVTEQLKSMGVKLTEDVKASVEAQVKDLLKPNALKPFIDAAKVEDKGVDPKGGFKNIAEFAQSVFRAEHKLRHGSTLEIDKRLIAEPVEKAAGTPAIHEYEPDYGGYLIPPEFRATLMEVAIQNSNIMKAAMLIPMASNTVNIPYVQGFDRSGGLTFGGISFQWIEEEAALTGVRPKLGQIGMRLRKVAAMAYVSNEMLEDSPISIEPLFTRMFTEALAWNLDWVCLNGSGAGQPLGIYNSPCLISVDKETSQDATTILYENVLKMYARMWKKSAGVWYANDNVLPQLGTMNLAVGVGGGPVYIPAGGASATPYDMLFGKPIIFTEHCRALGALGDIYFTDFSQYLIGQKAGTAGGSVKFDSSMHLKFDYDQMAYRLTFRIDGQPWWPSAITPRYATETLSPFVALAVRA